MENYKKLLFYSFIGMPNKFDMLVGSLYSMYNSSFKVLQVYIYIIIILC